jgi:nucleoside-diphosphate-sugar epimerase
MTFGRNAGNSPVSILEFLRADFAGFETKLMARCGRIDGLRLYLSGATGFFGKNVLALCAELHRRGAVFELTALSRAPEVFLAANAWCRGQPWLTWVRGDAREPWPGRGDFDLLLHAATDTHASAHVDKGSVFDGILAVTRRALEFSAAHRVRRLLLTGSGAQYGAIPADCSAGVPESAHFACDPSKPSSAYGEAKRASETLAALHAERHGCAVVNTRCFAFVGPGLPLDGHFAIGNFIRDTLGGQRIELRSAGEAVRSYLYGADLAVWLLILLLEADGGATINVGSDQGLRVFDLAKKVRDCLDPSLEVLRGPAVGGEERQFYLPAIATARAMGLDVWTGLEQAIRRTAQWHRGGVAT